MSVPQPVKLRNSLGKALYRRGPWNWKVGLLVCVSPSLRSLEHKVPKLSKHKLFCTVPVGAEWSTVGKFPAAANMFAVSTLVFSLGSIFEVSLASGYLLASLGSRAVSNNQCVA